jgi:hypothetical protein
MSRNIFCGSVRIVYAIIYTLFLVNQFLGYRNKPESEANIEQGFGLSIGSDFYFVVDRRARHTFYRGQAQNMTYTHGTFLMVNGSAPFVPINGVLARPMASASAAGHVNRGKINLTI